ncbi:hypothetical protein QBC40DRAFT_167075 [Triangularia verruculosa]|uniref:WSC domain-containing protein n=1 Tax=Triangularia verruculosa TaxID=2587418 RepID=A0AAN7AW32_9PEZI|nr:hypothetical protein QBC40DRAFT_167075 [Triangularia verruculosa]
MKSIALLAAALLALAEALPEHHMMARQLPKIIPVQQPTEDARLDAQTNQGCFKSAGNNMTMNQVIKFNSIGECAGKLCLSKGFAVAASMGGNQCWCGNKYPPEDDLVDNKLCDVGCPGFGEHACGGKNYFSVYNTGKTLDVDYAEDSGPTGDKHKTSTTSTTSAPTQVVTLPPSVVTKTPPPTDEEEKKGGKNVAGIVAGVVVGVIAAAGLGIGAYMYLRRKRNKEIEEEHRRNAAVSAFIGNPPGSSRGSGISGADSRMDPVMAQRRMSDGSIADNEDYSRKILRVSSGFSMTNASLVGTNKQTNRSPMHDPISAYRPKVMTTNELACILTFEHLHNIGVSGGDIYYRNFVHPVGPPYRLLSLQASERA